MTYQPLAFKVFQASAGSGKTYTIAKEYLKLCLCDKAAIDNYRQILAITFTNKAANEMKTKILDHLNDIINSDLTQAPGSMEAYLIKELGIDRESLKANAELLFQKIIHDYSSFCVSTIDAFTQKLSRSFAKELGLPSQFNVSIDEDEVADDITARIGEQIGTDDPLLTKVLEDFSEMKLSNEKSQKIAFNIHDFVKKLFKEEAFQKNESNHFETEEQYQQTRDFINNKIYPFEAFCKQFTTDFEGFIQRHNLTDEDFNYKAKGPCLSLLRSLKDGKYPSLGERQLQLIDGSFNWHSKTFKRSDLDAVNNEFQQVFVSFLKQYQRGLGAYLFYKSQCSKLSLYVLRSKIKSEIEAYIGEEQVVPISEFNKRINEILGDFSVPFIYERIGERFQHLFIDEFQDTSVLQWQNLLPLLDNNLSNKNLSMVVGDGKQSIYRWRNGEVGQIASLPEIYEKPSDGPIFQDYENNLIGNFDFTELKTNFRSFGNIIDFNNDYFDFSSNYLSEECRKVYIEKNKRFDKEVSIKQFHHKEGKGYVKIECLDHSDGDDEMMLSRTKEIIEETLEKGFQKSDITILVRKNITGSMVANYLNEQGIEVISSESIMLKSSDRVQLIVNTLDYLIHSDNAAVIAAVLYYWNATHREGFDGNVDGIFDKATSIAKGTTTIESAMTLKPDALKSLLAQSFSLYDLCSSLIRLYGFNTVGDSFLNFLLDTVDQWQSADEAGIKDFLEYWAKKKDSLAVLSGNEDAVKIMTIHKAKGLEFNVVICPFVVDNIDDKKANTLWISPQDLGFDAIPNIEKVQFTLSKDSATWSPQAKQLFDHENAMIRLDNLNINYVAFTRAVQRLYILSYRSDDHSKSPINAFLQDHPDFYGDADTRKEITEEKENETHDIFVESTSSEWFDKIAIDPDPSMFWVSKDDPMKPQVWGEYVHELLSKIQHKDDADNALKPYIDSGKINGTNVKKLKVWLEQMSTHPLIGKAFSDQAKVKNECDILMSNGEICRPDRYAELPDHIILLDYKTGQKSKDHHRQLREYMSVLTKMVAKPISAYLVYLDGTVEVVPVMK